MFDLSSYLSIGGDVRQWAQLLQRGLTLVGRDRRGRWVALVFLALAVTGLEAVGALLIFSLMGLIAAPGQGIDLPLVGDVATWFPDVEQRTLLLGVSGLIAGFFLLRAAVVIGQAYVQSRVVQNAGADLAVRLVRGYLELPYLFHTQQNSSTLVRNTVDSVNALTGQVLKPFVELVAHLMLVIGLIGVLVFVSPVATALAIGTLGPVIWLLLRIVQPRLKRLGRTAQDRRQGSLEALQQSLGGVRDIRLLRREFHFTTQFARQRRQLARAEYIRGMVSELPRALIETTLVLVILMVFVLAIVSGEGLDSVLSTLGLFAYASLRLQPSLRIIVTSLNTLKYGTAALDDLFEDLTRSEAALRAASERPVARLDSLPFSEAIRLRDVSFHYGAAADGAPALEGIDLTIAKGEFVGICGPTGGGKSTLVDLMVGLLEPTSGRVEVDGAPLTRESSWWYGKLGVVSQNVFLIDDSLRKNIAFGIVAQEIDERRLQLAIERAQLGGVVTSLPHGIETVVGERGIRLSGGQRQRVSIARALYHEPDVIVFDEGTSALDLATETALVAAIDALRENRTMISVAHRISTLAKADRIIVVEGGHIAACGTYDELIEQSHLFRSLAS